MAKIVSIFVLSFMILSSQAFAKSDSHLMAVCEGQVQGLNLKVSLISLQDGKSANTDGIEEALILQEISQIVPTDRGNISVVLATKLAKVTITMSTFTLAGTQLDKYYADGIDGSFYGVYDDPRGLGTEFTYRFVGGPRLSTHFLSTATALDCEAKAF